MEFVSPGMATCLLLSDTCCPEVNFEASNNIVNQSLESICEKEELLIENDEEHDQQLQNNKHKSDLPSNHAHENIQSESESSESDSTCNYFEMW
jgi:hypothetical protein